MSNDLISLSPRNLEEALRFADMLSKSSIVPKDFSGNPGNILVAIQWGMELGLQPMQAMQNIAVVNGRPALWGDAVIALVRNSPLCEYIYETDDGETASCRVKRRGEDEQIRTFSNADAAAAGLLNKAGPWTQYKKRMRQMRARAFAMRDVFPDVLRGMAIAEELQDMPAPTERDMGQAAIVDAEFDPEYLAFEGEQLPVLRDAAMGGMDSLQKVFAAIPASPHKSAMWKAHSAQLKGAASKANSAVDKKSEASE